MRALQTGLCLLFAVVSMLLHFASADFSDVLDKIEPSCEGILDGTIVLEHPEEKGVYRYVMCYNNSLLKNLAGSVWYDAGDDLVACIDGANYDFDIPYENLIQLSPHCPSYGKGLYEYVGDIEDIVAESQTFNGDVRPAASALDIPDDISGGEGMAGEEETGGISLTHYIIFALVLLIFGFGVYQVMKKEKVSPSPEA